MSNRLNMNNFLLSGDPRDEDKVNKGLTDMADLIKRGEAQSTNDAVHTALIQVESTEASWADNFAKPLRSEEHTSELQSRLHLVCRLLLEKKKSALRDHVLRDNGTRPEIDVTVLLTSKMPDSLQSVKYHRASLRRRCALASRIPLVDSRPV